MLHRCSTKIFKVSSPFLHNCLRWSLRFVIVFWQRSKNNFLKNIMVSAYFLVLLMDFSNEGLHFRFKLACVVHMLIGSNLGKRVTQSVLTPTQLSIFNSFQLCRQRRLPALVDDIDDNLLCFLSIVRAMLASSAKV